jgi:gluconokinase
MTGDHGLDAVIVMGVSGCGKSTVGALLAERIGGRFADADALHSPDAIQKMSRDTPLTDDDRWPWLDRVAATIATSAERPIIGCSALRRRYRDRLRADAGREVTFVHLDGTRAVLAERMGERAGHFMPLSLLDSQLATLESLDADERGIIVDIDADPERIVDDIVARLEALERIRA